MAKPPKKNREQEFMESINWLASRLPWLIVMVVLLVVLYTIAEQLFFRHL